ncbi:unnamed protein product [Pseudo-nitzschia multistriata]|uniref:Uncharacterized protein n=1 Tax=Pseudo-nitzschia multistriata TaxID=183589 RepID=A0A448ZJV6_9STRA|nr:unnamed protein product [Pseudo-nitzschia multistriata]
MEASFRNRLNVHGASSNNYNATPLSPGGSTISKNDDAKGVATKRELPTNSVGMHPFASPFSSHRVDRTCKSYTSANTSLLDGYGEHDLSTTLSSSIPLPLHVPTMVANGCSTVLGSTISTSSNSSSIGLPTKYPGSASHDRDNSLESIVMEELQDFDDIFGKSCTISGEASSSVKCSKNRCGDNAITNNVSPSRIQTGHQNYDDDDDLYTLSQSPRAVYDSPCQEESLLHRSRNHGDGNACSNIASDDEYDHKNATTCEFLSRIQIEHQKNEEADDLELPSHQSFPTSRAATDRRPSSGSIGYEFSASSPYPSVESLVKSKSTNHSNSSPNHRHQRSSSSSGLLSASSTSSTKSHRRSSNFAMGSSQFLDSVLKDL